LPPYHSARFRFAASRCMLSPNTSGIYMEIPPGFYAYKKQPGLNASIHPDCFSYAKNRFAVSYINFLVLGSLSFKLAKFGLLLIVLIQSSILSCIDNVYLFHSLFLFHIFLVPIQYHCYIAIIECSSGGLQVCLLFRE